MGIVKSTLFKNYLFSFVVIFLFGFQPQLFAQEENDLKEYFEMSLEELMSVKVVSASKREQKLREATATITVITAEDIKLSGATCIPDLLRSVPGLDIMSGWDSNIDVAGRGLNMLQTSKFLVLVNGQRVNMDYSGSIRWKEIPVFLENIKRIEVITSPLSALYGANSFSGMINIITKSADELKGLRADIRIGEKETQEYHLCYGSKIGKLKLGITAGWTKTEGWGNRDSSKVKEYVLPYDNKYAKLKDWREFSKATLNMEYPISEKSGILFSGGINFGNVAVPNLQGSEYKILNSHFKTNNRRLLMKYYSHPSEDSELKFHISSFYWEDEEGVMPSTSERYNGEMQYSRPTGTQNHIIAGIFGEILSSKSPDIGKKREDNLYGFYLQNEFKPSPKVIITTGFRFDKHTALKGVLSPRVILNLTPLKNHYFNLGIGSAFRKPSFLENYYFNETETFIGEGLLQKPDGKSKPEKIISYNLDYQNKITNRIFSRVNLFRNDIKDIILLRKKMPYPPYDWGVVYENYHRLWVTGGEIELKGILTDYLKCFANVSYQKLKYQTEVTSEKLSVPEIKGNFGFQCLFKSGLFTSAILHYVGEKEAQFGHFYKDKYYFMRIDPYTTIDINITYLLRFRWGELQFAITGFNIFDKEHLEFPIWDGTKKYLGVYDDPSKNWSEEKKREYINRNALHDRKIIGRISLSLF